MDDPLRVDMETLCRSSSREESYPTHHKVCAPSPHPIHLSPSRWNSNAVSREAALAESCIDKADAWCLSLEHNIMFPKVVEIVNRVAGTIKPDKQHWRLCRVSLRFRTYWRQEYAVDMRPVVKKSRILNSIRFYPVRCAQAPATLSLLCEPCSFSYLCSISF